MTIHRTKLLAAAVLLAGGLSSVAGSGLLAGPQPPPPTTPPVADRPAAGESAAPATRPAAPASAPAPGVIFGAWSADFASARRWEYDFAPAGPVEAAKLVAMLRDREARGWEFVGQVTLLRDGRDAPHWAFRRAPDPAAPGGTPGTEGHYLPARGTPTLQLSDGPARGTPTLGPDEPANPAGSGPAKQADLEKRVRDLELMVRYYEAILKEEGREVRQEVVIPAKEVGLAPTEMLAVLVKLADRRFGPDARRRLEMTADARGLTVRGDAEAVRWARDVIKRMSDR